MKINYYTQGNRHIFDLLNKNEVVTNLSMYVVCSDIVYIENIETLENYRGKGYAKILFNYAINKFGRCIFVGNALDESIFFWLKMNCRYTQSPKGYHHDLFYID